MNAAKPFLDRGVPEEPWPAVHRVRKLDGMLLSAHRAGALDEVLERIAELVLADLALILKKLRRCASAPSPRPSPGCARCWCRSRELSTGCGHFANI
jgi:hypothetical protein